MRWRTRDRSFLEKMKMPADDTIDITKPMSVNSNTTENAKPKSSSNKLLAESTNTKLPTGAGFLGALDKVKEPRFLSGRKEKRNNIKLNL